MPTLRQRPVGETRMFSVPSFPRLLQAKPPARFGARKLLQSVLLAAIAPCLLTIPANAQSSRTYVSGVGKDTGSCTANAPCKTLQAALAKTVAGGQIYALDSA